MGYTPEQNYREAKARIKSGVPFAGDEDLVTEYEANIDSSGGGFYSAAAATLDEPQGDLLTNFYRNLYNTDEEETYDPGTHMYEWDKFIYPNSPSTDMYHQMAMYNKMENEAPQGKWAKRAYGLYNYPKIIGGSLINDWGQGFLDYGIDQKQGNLTGPLTSYLADQNPIPQGIERLKGANQFIKESWGGERTPEFNEAYNQTVEIPRNIERTAGRVDPSGNVMAYGLNGGGIVKDKDDYYDYDPSTFTNLSMRGDSSTRYRRSEEDSWDTEFWTARNPDTNQAMTESLVYHGPDMISNRFVEPSGQWKDYATGEGGQLKGPQTWMYDPPRGVAGTDLAQSQWKRPENMEKTIKSLEIRPEFEGWTHDEIKYWIINQARANRGGIIGLL
jgi:hypothetical protein